MWQECEGHLLKDGALQFRPIRPSVDDIDVDRLERDVHGAFKYFKREEDKEWWANFFRHLPGTVVS